MEGVESIALGGNLCSKLQELVSVMLSRIAKREDLERLKLVALEGKLTQWPLLQSVLVLEDLDVEFLEAVFLINGVTEFFEHRVHHLRRRAIEIVNVNIGGELKVVLLAPLVDGVSLVLSPALVYLHAIELDLGIIDILGPFEDDRGLVGHGQERDIVDVEKENISQQIVAKRYFPIENIIL